MRAMLLLLVLGVSQTRPARAQLLQSDAGTYRLWQGMLEVGRESFRRSPGRFENVAVIPALNLRLESQTAWDSAGRFRDFTLTLRNAAGDSPRGGYRVRAEGDSVRVSADGGTRDTLLPADFDAVLPPQSVAGLAQLAVLAKGHDTALRVLAAGLNRVLPVTVRWQGDTAHLTLARLEIVALARAGRIATVDVPLQKAHAVLTQVGESLPPLAGLHRPVPDYSVPDDAPYTAAEVRVAVHPESGDSFSLGCTFTLPRSRRGRVPAVVTITGSGQQSRDEDLWPLVPEYRPFRQIADRLARAGIASLRCDDRGKDASTGSPAGATSADLAGDTRSQIAWLRSRPEIDPRRIALVGHSEGGAIGPLIARDDARLAALVIMAGPAKPGADILRDQARWPVLTAPDLTPEERRQRLAEADSAVQEVAASPSAWLRWFYHYDPLPTARAVRQPTLILQGALDRQVSAGQADTLARALREGGNRDVTEQVFPGLNHLFLPTAGDGSPSEYPTLRDTAVPDTVLDVLTGWLRRHLGSS